MIRRILFVLVLIQPVCVYATQWTLGSSQFVAGMEYAAAMTCIQKGNLESARVLLISGSERSGSDALFLPQLAGVAYKSGDRELAKQHLQRLLKTDPNHAYANEFLGSLFLLDENLEAALKYWNRIGQPHVQEIEMQPSPHVKLDLIEHALVAAPASILRLKDYVATENRFEEMGVFRSHDLLLRPRSTHGNFDLILRPQVKRGTFTSKFKMAAMLAHGVFTDTVKIDFPNISGKTINFTNWISWDEYRNRIRTSLSVPYGDAPHLRIRLFADGRKETWWLGTEDLLLSTWESGVEFSEPLSNGDLWRSGASFSVRDFGNPQNTSPYQDGTQAKIFGEYVHSLLRVPEARFVLDSRTKLQSGTFLGALSPWGSVEQSLEVRWFLNATGDDLLFRSNVAAGKSFGNIPFDEYFVLGADLGDELFLRAHRSSMEKKGENPTARSYVLMNSEISKHILDIGKLRWRLTPFLDVAHIAGAEAWDGPKWFFDVGVQSGLKVYGSTELVLTYGKNLRTGRNVFYLGAQL